MGTIVTARPVLPVLAGRRGWPPAASLAVAIGVFAALSLYCNVRSEGFLEADAMTHFTFSRHADTEPAYYTNVWGRPIVTAAYAIPANLFADVRSSVIAVRVTTLLLAIACALITYRVARNQGLIRPELAAIALLAQPLFFCHSWSELTEIPFALLAVLAMWAYQARRFFWVALIVSVTPACRPEGFGLMMISAVGLLLHRRWYWLLVMPIPLLVWSAAGALVEDRTALTRWGDFQTAWWGWLPRNWPYSATSAYGRGPLLHFFVRLPILLGPMMLPFFFAGAVVMVRRCLGKARDAFLGRPIFRDHVARCELVLLAVPVSIFVVHSLLWWLGKMASNGELRYLLCVAPFWAVVAGRGFDWAWARMRLPAPVLVAGLLAVVPPVVANRFWQVVPIPLYDNDYMGKIAGDWYRADAALTKSYPRVMATPPSMWFFMDISQSDRERGLTWTPANVKACPPGTILFWDPVYGQSNADATLVMSREVVEKHGWVYVGNVVYGGAWCNVYLSTKDVNGNPSVPGKWTTPGNVE